MYKEKVNPLEKGNFILENMHRLGIQLPDTVIKLAVKVKTPQDIYDYLKGKKYEPNSVLYTPDKAIKAKKLHCYDGAFLGFTLGLLNNMDVRMIYLEGVADNDHMIVVFKEKGKYGAFSQSGNPEIVWREPVFESVEDLVFSFKKGYPRGSARFSDVVGYSEEMNEDFFRNRGIGFIWMISSDAYKQVFHVITNKLKYRLFVDLKNRNRNNWIFHPLLTALQKKWIILSKSDEYEINYDNFSLDEVSLFKKFFRLIKRLKTKDDDRAVRKVMWQFFEKTGTTPEDIVNMVSYLNNWFKKDGFKITELTNDLIFY